MTENRAEQPRDVFGAYAGFYDALYADKDYEAECDFLVDVFSAHGVPAGGSLLDLGCGTGGHVIPLVERGYQVTGVDRAETMLAEARRKADLRGVSPEFALGDVRSVSLGRTFDAVVSMFAVVSYQLTNDDLSAMFATARRHLRPGGLFVFDGWFGPAVLSERPEPRTKVIEMPGGERITRAAEPSLDVVAQTVEVAYEVTREVGGQVVERVQEAHPMRFLFAQELQLLLGLAGFEVTSFGSFADIERPITASDWNFSLVARAR